MSHNIEYFEYDENVHRGWVQKDLDTYVAIADRQEGCSGLNQSIRWLECLPIFQDRDAAENAITNHDRGWYDQLAVRYYEPIRDNANKKVQELQQKVRDAYDAYLKKDRPIWAQGVKAEYVSCRKCGSKLKREYIKTNRCPVCGSDLRPDTTLKAVEGAKEKHKKAQKALDEYIKAHSKKKVKWLVKIEFHT